MASSSSSNKLSCGFPRMITVVVVVALAIVLTLPHSSNSMPVDGGEKNVAPEVVAVVNSNERQGCDLASCDATCDKIFLPRVTMAFCQSVDGSPSYCVCILGYSPNMMF